MPIFLKVNHQLESRMQEICQSGSEGGAKPTFVPTPIATPKEPSRRVRSDRAQPIREVFLVEMCALFLKEG